MWFVFVLVGLVLLTACGLYARRRLTNALAYAGVGRRTLRVLRWVIAWLLFGYPLLVIVAIVLMLALDWETLPRFDGTVGALLLGYPFAWAMLVVFQSVLWLVALDLICLFLRRRAFVTRLRAIGVCVVLGAFAVYTPARILWERDDLGIRQWYVGASATPPLRIAFLADIQQDDHTDGARAREVYAVINGTRPDLILSGGDWINTGPAFIEDAAAAAGTLTSRLGTLSVRGDHEHFAYRDRNRSVAEVEDALRRHGVAMLADQVRWIDHAGKRIAIVFLDYNYVHRSAPETVASLLASVAAADYAIVVTHQLDKTLAAMLRDRVDLVLAAHTHGGQVNPVVGLVHVPLARLETEHIDGRYALGARTTVIVTAGIGTSVLPIRYAAPGSIELIELRP